jgi:hypothetical protein
LSQTMFPLPSFIRYSDALCQRWGPNMHIQLCIVSKWLCLSSLLGDFVTLQCPDPHIISKQSSKIKCWLICLFRNFCFSYV